MEDNKKAPNYLADQQDDDYAKPEWVRDTRGDLVMNLPGYTSMSFGVRAGSKIISTSTSDQSNNSTTSASSLSSGTITSTVAVGTGDVHGNTNGVTIDGEKSRITIGEYPATLGYSWIMDKNHIGGYQNTGLIFGMILQDGQYRLGTATGLTDMKKGEFMFGNYPTAYVRFIPATTSVDSHLIVHATLDGADGNFSGTITATTGNIGGWTIGATSLTGSNISLNSSGSIIIGTGNDIINLSSTDSSYRMWVGNTNEALAPFSITKAGAIKSVSGIIGGFTIKTTTLGSNATDANANIFLDSTNSIIRAGATTGNYINIDGANLRIRSSNYVPGYFGAGFTLEPNLLEVGNIVARGMIRTSVFQKDTISTIGGSFAVLDGDVLDVDMTASDNSTMTTKGTTTFAVGDILRIKDGTDDEWFEVIDASSKPTYVVTRDKSGSYASNNNPQWTRGSAIVNYKQNGNGGIYMTASENNAPYMSIFDHTGTPWSTINTRLRIGNLNGFLGYTSNLYGMAVGDSTNYFKYDSTNGLRISGNITATSGTIGGWTIASDELSSGKIKLQSASERILIGDVTDFTTGIGIIMGKDSSTYKFRIGDPDKSNVYYDGKNLDTSFATANISVECGETYIFPGEICEIIKSRVLTEGSYIEKFKAYILKPNERIGFSPYSLNAELYNDQTCVVNDEQSGKTVYFWRSFVDYKVYANIVTFKDDGSAITGSTYQISDSTCYSFSACYDRKSGKILVVYNFKSSYGSSVILCKTATVYTGTGDNDNFFINISGETNTGKSVWSNNASAYVRMSLTPCHALGKMLLAMHETTDDYYISYMVFNVHSVSGAITYGDKIQDGYAWADNYYSNVSASFDEDRRYGVIFSKHRSFGGNVGYLQSTAVSISGTTASYPNGGWYPVTSTSSIVYSFHSKYIENLHTGILVYSDDTTGNGYIVAFRPIDNTGYNGGTNLQFGKLFSFYTGTESSKVGFLTVDYDNYADEVVIGWEDRTATNHDFYQTRLKYHGNTFYKIITQKQYGRGIGNTCTTTSYSSNAKKCVVTVTCGGGSGVTDWGIVYKDKRNKKVFIAREPGILGRKIKLIDSGIIRNNNTLGIEGDTIYISESGAQMTRFVAYQNKDNLFQLGNGVGNNVTNETVLNINRLDEQYDDIVTN